MSCQAPGRDLATTAFPESLRFLSRRGEANNCNEEEKSKSLDRWMISYSLLITLKIALTDFSGCGMNLLTGKDLAVNGVNSFIHPLTTTRLSLIKRYPVLQFITSVTVVNQKLMTNAVMSDEQKIPQIGRMMTTITVENPLVFIDLLHNKRNN